MFNKKQKTEEKNTELGKLKHDLAHAHLKAEENLAGWKRALADFVNYKKIQEEEKKSFLEFANADLIFEILPVLDNFNAAWKVLPKDLEKNPWVAGIGHVRGQLENILKNRGVEEVGKIGEEFNPQFHEAVEKIEDKKAEKKEKATIKEILQKGYKLNGQVLRPAKVKVV